MRKFNTLTGFLLSKSTNPTTEDTAVFKGYSSVGDGGDATWKHNGVTGQAASQSPAQLGNTLLNDASGNQWSLLISDSGFNARAVGCKLNATSLLDAATDDILPLRAAQAGALANGGGTVWLGGLAALSDTLTVNQRVVFRGSAPFFANQFTDNEVRPGGSGFYALPGLNGNPISIKLDVYNDGGVLRESISNEKLLDYRHFGGVMDLLVFGNRSNTANPPTVTDKNTIGSGIICSGVRYPIVQNVVTMMCAEKGIETVSFDYGLGANACNNLLFSRLSSLSNADNGASLSGGDSIVTELNLGYNGKSGLSSTMGRSTISGISWNNQLDGVNTSSGTDVTMDFNSYDNERNGFRLSGLFNAVINGTATANGRDVSLASTERCGVVSTSSNEHTVLNVSTQGEYLGSPYQRYGYNIINTTHDVFLGGAAIALGNSAADWLISTPANIVKGTNAP